MFCETMMGQSVSAASLRPDANLEILPRISFIVRSQAALEVWTKLWNDFADLPNTAHIHTKHISPPWSRLCVFWLQTPQSVIIFGCRLQHVKPSGVKAIFISTRAHSDFILNEYIYTFWEKKQVHLNCRRTGRRTLIHTSNSGKYFPHRCIAKSWRFQYCLHAYKIKTNVLCFGVLLRRIIVASLSFVMISYWRPGPESGPSTSNGAPRGSFLGPLQFNGTLMVIESLQYKF